VINTARVITGHYGDVILESAAPDIDYAGDTVPQVTETTVPPATSTDAAPPTPAGPDVTREQVIAAMPSPESLLGYGMERGEASIDDDGDEAIVSNLSDPACTALIGFAPGVDVEKSVTTAHFVGGTGHLVGSAPGRRHSLWFKRELSGDAAERMDELSSMLDRCFALEGAVGRHGESGVSPVRFRLEESKQVSLGDEAVLYAHHVHNEDSQLDYWRALLVVRYRNSITKLEWTTDDDGSSPPSGSLLQVGAALQQRLADIVEGRATTAMELGEIQWADTSQVLGRLARTGGAYTGRCRGAGSLGSIWGSNPYTGDSSICTAAVHAGRIDPATGGVVTFRITQGQSSYPGTDRNGVSSSSYGPWESSFEIL
jgi:hypothetical protein